MTAVLQLRRTHREAARSGGTVRLYGPAGVEQLDPATVHGVPAVQVVRLFSRQLVTYEPHADLRNWQAIAPVPDVAVHVPSNYNAGLGASQRSYVFHLRPGVLWDSAPPRPVTAYDFVRGFKRLGNPVTASPALAYFTSTIRGMAEFCAGFAEAVPGRTEPELLAAYPRGTDIPGVFALDDETLVIEVLRPTPDFPNILALSCASAAPVEYDTFLPGSPELRRNLRANGPYRIAQPASGAELQLERNPAWTRESDPVRPAHVDRIEIVQEAASTSAIEAKIDAGEADLAWARPLRVPVGGRTPDTPPALNDGLDRPQVSYALDPYLIFNVSRKAAVLGDLTVRRAVAAAVDKPALAELYRRLCGHRDVQVANRIVPPNNHPRADARDTGAAGDPRGARSLLADAGYAGLTLTAVHRRDEPETQVAWSYAADLEKAGMEIRLVALDDAEYDRVLAQSARGGAGDWDVAAGSWSAHWLYRNGRAFLEPLVQSGANGNYGGYSNPEVDDLIVRALEAAVQPLACADAAWRAVEDLALEDVAILPLLFCAPSMAQRCSERTRDAVAMPALGYAYDIATLWLDRAGR